MTKEALKARCLQLIEDNKAAIIDIGQEFSAHPELGFKEHNTAALVRSTFERLGIPTGINWPSPASGVI